MIAEQLPISEIINIGNAFAASGMFTDIKSAAQAIVKIQAGQEIGIPPFAAMTGIHIISGKPSIGAGIMAARVKGSGKYNYSVVRGDGQACIIEFFQGDKSLGKSEFTLQDAQRAGTKNLDKFPKNMLFARAMSNGVRFYCPDIFSGPVYVPEEMETVTEDAQPLSVTTAVPAAVTVVLPAAPVILAKDHLTTEHPNFEAVKDALLNKGYSVDQVKLKYDVSPEMDVLLEAIVKARPLAAAAVGAGQPTTQEMVDQANKAYVPPVSSPKAKPF